jgi:hypothetical protein
VRILVVLSERSEDEETIDREKERSVWHSSCVKNKHVNKIKERADALAFQETKIIVVYHS